MEQRTSLTEIIEYIDPGSLDYQVREDAVAPEKQDTVDEENIADSEESN